MAEKKNQNALGEVVLLSGGNAQIAKACGGAPVRLTPPPPGASKQANVRYLAIDNAQFLDWVRQASQLPG